MNIVKPRIALGCLGTMAYLNVCRGYNVPARLGRRIEYVE